MYEKCPQCQQKAMEDGVCGACCYVNGDFDHPPLNPFDPLNEHGLRGSTTGEFLRKAMQACYCLELDDMCEHVYGTKLEDMPDHRKEYMKGKFDLLQSDALTWICQFDSSHLQAFADYVLRKEA